MILKYLMHINQKLCS